MYLQYEKQWTIFDHAEALGWAGHRPGVLGTFSSNKALEEAQEFLLNKELEDRSFKHLGARSERRDLIVRDR